jgi:secreted PhoX family phosphatase
MKPDQIPIHGTNRQTAEEDMTNFLKTGGVSRRGVLKGATAIGAAALVTPWGTPLRAQPQRGGTLRVAIATGGSTDALDPAPGKRSS